MSEQMQFFEDSSAEMMTEHKRQLALKRRWENLFQKWSDKHGIDGDDGYGCCGFGSMCDWCEDNSYGRPCVRALNQMCREKGIVIDYNNYNFEEIW